MVRGIRRTQGFVIVGLFGNEFAMEQAIKILSELKDVEYKVTSRRHLSIRLKSADPDRLDRVKKIVQQAHGYVEQEARL